MEWKTIDTAPTDGSLILIYLGRYRYPEVHCAFFDKDKSSFTHDGEYYFKKDDITHWMIIPSPPLVEDTVEYYNYTTESEIKWHGNDREKVTRINGRVLVLSYSYREDSWRAWEPCGTLGGYFSEFDEAKWYLESRALNIQK